jgi:hypothetical protein
MAPGGSVAAQIGPAPQWEHRTERQAAQTRNSGGFGRIGRPKVDAPTAARQR